MRNIILFLLLIMISLPALAARTPVPAESLEAQTIKAEAMAHPAAKKAPGEPGNDPARAEWFQDQALGMFIHWGVDCPLGTVISHHLIGADKNYQDRFFAEMPGYFYPKDFQPDDWARLAKLAGMKYVVFTTKHHAGFCMWDTKTTTFSIMNTPYQKDITRMLFDAFRKQGIKIGVYFSPDDFWMLHKQGHLISRNLPEADPTQNPELMAHNLAQVRELLTNYGKIDVIFFDGKPDQLKQLAWKLQPGILVTRGEMATPEQKLPATPMPGPWEACFTMGTEWPFKPTNEEYKTGIELIRMVIEVRAKGGNLLLNCGPDPDGVIPFEQTRRLRELALWLFVNGEAIYNIRPWIVTNEGSVWFTRAKDTDTVFAFETAVPWEWGTWRDFTFKSVRATAKTEVAVVGESGENRPKFTDSNKPTFKQEADGLHVRAMYAQRLYTDYKWPNPIVLRLTHVEPVKEAVAGILKANKAESRLFSKTPGYIKK